MLPTSLKKQICSPDRTKMSFVCLSAFGWWKSIFVPIKANEMTLAELGDWEFCCSLSALSGVLQHVQLLFSSHDILFVCVEWGFFFVVTDGGVPGKQKRDLVSLFPVSLSMIYSFIFTKCFILVMVDPDSITMIRTLSVRQEYTLDGTQWDTFWYVAGLY